VSPLDLLGLCGITVILTRGTLFRGLRRIAPHFLGCPMCVGWHVGFWGSLAEAITQPHSGTVASVVAFLVHAIVVGGAVSLGASIGGGLLDHFFGSALNDHDTPPDGLLAAARRAQREIDGRP